MPYEDRYELMLERIAVATERIADALLEQTYGVSTDAPGPDSARSRGSEDE